MVFYLRIILFLTLITSVTGVSANNPSGEIKGTIKDYETEQSIEYATIALYNQTDSRLVTGTISNSDGVFVITNIPFGNYFIKFTCLGYKEKTIGNISIGENQETVNIGKIQLKANIENLDEVVISAEKRAIEYHIDKDVINVAESSNNAGGMAADVLGNHPTIQTGLNGSIRLRGSTNFIVLIDGKPTSDESTDILNQIPASSIDKIEIITNPSAKYDANHASGIVNLITRKNTLNGFSGIFSGSVSNAERYNADISLKYRKEKMNISIQSNLYYNPRFQDRTSVDKRIVDEQVGFLNFHSDNILLWEGKNINVAIDYNVSAKNTVSFFVNRSSSTFGWSPKRNISEGIDKDINYYLLDDFMRNYREAWHYNVSNIHRFSDKGHELSFDANVIMVDMSRVNNQYLYHSNIDWEIVDLAEEYHLKRHQNITRQQYRADYSLPYSEHNKLELGILMKLDNRTIENDITSQIFSDNDEVLNKDKYKSYNNLYATYATLNYHILKSNLQFGLRAEFANRNTTLVNGDFNNTYSQLDFFPSLNLNHQFLNNHKIRFSYRRSIWRPTDLQLNPTIYYRDISGEFSGNAKLNPSYTNSIELNYYLPFNKNSISVMGFYKRMKNNITTVRYLTQDSIYRNNPENLQGEQRDIGVEFSGNLKLFKWLNLNPSGNFYNGYINGNVTNQEINHRANVWSARIIVDIKPFTNTRLQLNTYYNSSTLGAQFYMEEIYGLSLSIKQNLFKNKLSISISGNDILQTEKRQFIIEGDNFKQRITDIFPKHPIYTLNLTFKLNNFNKKQRENIEQGIGFF